MLDGVDVTYENTRREIATDKGVLRYHEAWLTAHP